MSRNTLAERFMSLFKGNNEAYGYYKITGEETDRNKKSGTASTKSKPVDLKQWIDHLDGTAGVGIIPITPENKCCWGCIDIDIYPIDHKELLKKFNELEIPIVICRSKSNGAHCFLFTKNWVPAKDMRKLLTKLAISIGHAGKEIYPAQDYLKKNSSGICIGNWLNMPYFNLNTRTCVMLDRDDLEPEEFLDYTTKRKLDGKDFDALLDKWCSESIDKEDISDILKGAPCCLQNIGRRGIVNGEKNTVIFNYGVYTKKRYPQDWSAKLDEVVETYSLDKITSRELEGIKSSLMNNKDYFYQCKKEPLRSYCNPAVCAMKEFGIDAAEILPNLRNLRCVMTNPCIFYLDTDIGTINLNVKELNNQTLFREACMEQVQDAPNRCKARDWDMIIQKLLKDVKKIDPPKDADDNVVIFQALHEYLINKISEHKECLKEPNGVYLSDDGFVYFKLNDVRLHLIKRNIIPKDVTKLQFSRIMDMIAKKALDTDEKVIITGNIKIKKETVYVRGIHSDYLDLIEDENANEENEDVV